MPYAYIRCWLPPLRCIATFDFAAQLITLIFTSLRYHISPWWYFSPFSLDCWSMISPPYCRWLFSPCAACLLAFAPPLIIFIYFDFLLIILLISSCYAIAVRWCHFTFLMLILSFDMLHFLFIWLSFSSSFSSPSLFLRHYYAFHCWFRCLLFFIISLSLPHYFAALFDDAFISDARRFSDWFRSLFTPLILCFHFLLIDALICHVYIFISFAFDLSLSFLSFLLLLMPFFAMTLFIFELMPLFAYCRLLFADALDYFAFDWYFDYYILRPFSATGTVQLYRRGMHSVTLRGKYTGMQSRYV